MSEASQTEDRGFLDRLPWYTVPGILLGVPFLLWVGSRLARDAVYSNFVCKYYWGPIKADALTGTNLFDCGNGVTAAAGYNIANTATWAVLLGVCLIGLAQLLHHFRQPMDNKLILGSTAWVLAGSVFHVLQDTDLFLQPLEFFFITPPIYLMFAAGGVTSILVAEYGKFVHRKTGSLEAAMQKVWFGHVIVVLIYTALWLREWDQIVHYVNPAYFTLYMVAGFLLWRWRMGRLGHIQSAETTGIFALPWTLLSLHYVLIFLDEPWVPQRINEGLEFAFWASPLIAAAIAGVVYLVAKRVYKNGEGKTSALAFMAPINLVLIFSQMVDAIATAIGIDLGPILSNVGYTEKHVLSEFVRRSMERFGEATGFDAAADFPTFLGFAPVKLLVSLLVVYVIDVESKEDVKKYPTMIGLIKFAIIMVGIGPGTRNMVRMSLGV